jgi:heme oxygenase
MTAFSHFEQPRRGSAGGDGSLSRRLRTETKELHTAAERSGIMNRLVRGQVSRPEYVVLLQNLAEIYRALEDELRRHHSHPALSWLDLDALARLDRIERDIEALRGADDAAATIQPATRAYVETIRDAAATQPELLLAHAYVRYLGDLSGGQILAPIVGRIIGGNGRSGVEFYGFPLITDVEQFKQRFREGLDRSADSALSDRIIEETKTAFVLHEVLFREIEQD